MTRIPLDNSISAPPSETATLPRSKSTRTERQDAFTSHMRTAAQTEAPSAPATQAPSSGSTPTAPMRSETAANANGSLSQKDPFRSRKGNDERTVRDVDSTDAEPDTGSASTAAAASTDPAQQRDLALGDGAQRSGEAADQQTTGPTIVQQHESGLISLNSTGDLASTSDAPETRSPGVRDIPSEPTADAVNILAGKAQVVGTGHIAPRSLSNPTAPTENQILSDRVFQVSERQHPQTVSHDCDLVTNTRVERVAPVPDTSGLFAVEAIEKETESTSELHRQGASAERTGSSAAASDSSTSTPPALGRLPQYLLARTGSHASAVGPDSEAEQGRFIQRVARAFDAARHRNGEVRLRLSPPELGSMRLELKLQGGILTAHIEAETTTARALLLDGLPILRERLAGQGIRVEHFEVDVPERQPGGLPDGAASEGHQNWRSSSAATPMYAEPTPEESTRAVSSVIGYVSDTHLNVVV